MLTEPDTSLDSGETYVAIPPLAQGVIVTTGIIEGDVGQYQLLILHNARSIRQATIRISITCLSGLPVN